MAKVYDNATDIITFSRGSSGTALRRVGYGDELVDTLNQASSWQTYGSNTVEQDGDSVKITYVDHGSGAYDFLSASHGLSQDLVVGKVYKISLQAKVSSGGSVIFRIYGTSIPLKDFTITSDGYVDVEYTFVAESSHLINTPAMDSGEVIWLKNVSVKEVFLDRATDPLVLFNYPDDMPRIDFDINGEAKGLLIEEQRTNLLLNSDNPGTQVATLPAGSHTLSFVGGPSVTGIDDNIDVNAVDVFVYDTSKDTDGGAWRTGSLAQASSWYNEALNTDFRGSRREFPEVAVIVAEANKVTIYDGDDPSLPMWMVFEGGTPGLNNGPYVYAGGTRTVESVHAAQGTMVFGSNNTSGTGVGMFIIDFLRDRSINIRPTSTLEHFYPISGRNTSVTNEGYVITNTDYGQIVDDTVNDVAITVLPDAPIDAATGLPVPTIAVATDGGVSVIKDDGTVVDITGQTQGILHVSFNSDEELISTGNFQDQYFVYSLPPSDIAYNNGIYLKRFYTIVSTPALMGGVATSLIETHIASNKGLNSFAEDTTTPANDMVAYTTSDYATGWMNGDIKLAALADTTAETLSGSNLITNSEFTTGTSGWTFEGTATDTSAAGYLEGITGAATNVLTSTAITTVSGKTYVVTGDIVSTDNFGAIMAGSSIYAQDYGNSGYLTSGSFAFFTFKATSTTSYISVFAGDANKTVRVDNISVRLADPDRSVNGNGLGVHGSITKAPVATGADVVAYSGFSTSNYLEQPYNSALNFGTGDFCVMGWVKTTDNYAALLTRDDTSNPFFMQIRPTDQLLVQFGGIGHYFPSAALSSGSWTKFAVVRASGTAITYVNGTEVSRETSKFVNVSANANGNMAIGYDPYAGVANLTGSLALIRISATAPTAEQIAKIYEDEKVLFQENAKATLTGSSDAVTALAHDPDTDLLHVGTSDGRSVFYGLRRVNETATAVTTAISAVDGLIVEQ